MKTNKKSPFTGGSVELLSEQATTTFRGERYQYTSYYYKCNDTGRLFSDNEVDDKSLDQVYDQYRLRHGIPSKEEIRQIREQFNLSALAMSKILGLGDNQYRLYEEGTIPVESVGKLIALARQKVNMLALLDSSKALFPEKEYTRYYEKINSSAVSIVLPIYTPYYIKQGFQEQPSGQLIQKRITKTITYKKENYATAVNY